MMDNEDEERFDPVEGELWPDSSDDEEADELYPGEHRVLSWRQLRTRTGRLRWYEQLWQDVCELRLRFRLAVRSRWWEDELQVEALAAMAAWVNRYDTGDWDDPPGKLTLLFELERLETLLRDGNDPFHPRRDRPDFERHLELIGGRPAG